MGQCHCPAFASCLTWDTLGIQYLNIESPKHPKQSKKRKQRKAEDPGSTIAQTRIKEQEGDHPKRIVERRW